MDDIGAYLAVAMFALLFLVLGMALGIYLTEC